MTVGYHSAKRQTRVFIHGLKLPEMKSLTTEIETLGSCIGLPTLTASLLLGSRVRIATTRLQHCHQNILEVEHRTSIRPNWHPHQPCCTQHANQDKGQNRLDTIDFDAVTNDLTSLLSRLAYCELLSTAHCPMLTTLDAINQSFVDFQPASTTLEAARKILLAQNEYLNSALTGVLARSQCLSKRAQAQVQTVGDCFAVWKSTC